jgi:hypothetical protein
MMKATGKSMSDPEPEPLESLDLRFNYEPGALRRAGIDPRTSEGKARITALLINGLLALKREQLQFERQVGPAKGPVEFWAILKALLAEGP